jgi:dihydropteroate synthase
VTDPIARHTYGSIEIDYSQRPYVMGIVNVTPDSFSDGGMYSTISAASQRALALLDEGADFVDIGGESSRPGSDRISADVERDRVIPVIEKILHHRSDALLSIDTTKADVADAALERGCVIVNDISALRMDARMAATIHRHNASVVLMHMKGEPKTMQDNPGYTDVIDEIRSFFIERIGFARRNGIERILLDPGIGFGKRVSDNLEIIRSLEHLRIGGCPLLIGASRKSFLGAVGGLPIAERLEGGLAAAALAVFNGASVVRTHDVSATRRAVQLAYAVRTGAAFQEQAPE